VILTITSPNFIAQLRFTHRRRKINNGKPTLLNKLSEAPKILHLLILFYKCNGMWIDMHWSVTGTTVNLVIAPARSHEHQIGKCDIFIFYVYWPVCVLRWTLRALEERNACGQNSHLYGVSPLCLSMCTFKLTFSVNLSPHTCKRP
jgi:hypothetical protein